MTDFHAFKTGGKNFIYFPRSARLYHLSAAAAGILAGLSDTLGMLEVSTTLKALPLDGAECEAQLYDELRDVLVLELEVPQPVPLLREEPRGSNLFQTFSLYLAQSCNMSCCYCWNRGGSFGKPASLMEEKQTQLVIDLILSLVDESSANKIFINFYGGEPLLNFAALKKITLDLRSCEERLGITFLFTVDTNGSLLEGETAQFLASHFAQIGVSLDGRQEIHDQQRPGKHGETTWQRIVDNVKAFPAPKLLGLRATLTAQSDSYLETFNQLTRLGVGRIQLEYCHEPGYHQNPIYEKLIVAPERQVEELLQFVDHYVENISSYNADEIPFLSNVIDNITRIRRGNRFTRPCGAGVNTLAINSRGEIFPCIAFVDRDQFIMGRAGSENPLSLHQTLTGFDVDSQSPCQTCWLRYDCAGGCYATHYDMSGHTRHPHPEYCQMMRAKAEVYFYAMAQMLVKCPWHLKKPTGSSHPGRK